MNELEFYRAVFQLLDERNRVLDPGDIFIDAPNKNDGSRARFFVNCNDVFDWGTADCDELLPEDIEPLKDACKQCLDVHPIFGYIYGPMLWASRKRGVRPQGAMWSNIPMPLWPLFEAAAPERAVTLFNPLTPLEAVRRAAVKKAKPIL